MTTLTKPRKEVEQRIRDAFADVKLGHGVSLRQAQVIDNFGEGVTDEEFDQLPLSEETENWERVTFEELESDNIAHLDPEGFRYYLPAFMLSVLENYDALSLRVMGTLSALCPDQQFLGYHLSRYAILSYEQKQAVACFLEALPELVEIRRDDQQMVQQAMSRYWTQFLPLVLPFSNQNQR